MDEGLQIDVTGLNNEPSLSTNDVQGWKFDGIVTAVKELRRQLDVHQLQRIGIVAPEGANADVWLLQSVLALNADPRSRTGGQAVFAFTMIRSSVNRIAAKAGGRSPCLRRQGPGHGSRQTAQAAHHHVLLVVENRALGGFASQSFDFKTS